MTDESTWYLSRASGLVAWLLLAVAVVWGLLLSSRVLDRRPSPAWLLDLHRHLGSLALTLTALHLGAIWFDDYVDYTTTEILVPFTSDLERGAVALGTIGLWLLVAVQASSWQRARLSGPLWRRIHLTSGPLLALTGIHAWLVGTDIAHPAVVVTAIVLGAEIAFLVGLRIRYRRAPVPVDAR